jgi:uncharacterized protein (DUF1800 family)
MRARIGVMLRATARTVTMAVVALVAGCSRPATRPSPAPPSLTLSAADVRWLDRVSFGVDTSLVADYRRLGRNAFLEEQLHPGRMVLPAGVATQIEALEITHLDPLHELAAVNAEYRRINTLAEGDARDQARKALNDRGNALAYQAIRRDLLRAVYSPAQLQEQMVWFWLNHFSVQQYKGNLRWLIGDYEERAIRPHALGSFRDLVLATLTHPAMLQYLDNAQNAAGHVNENYARELMELHTLGVNAGYAQHDVQELARILTGVGINAGEAPRLRREWQPLYRREGAFEFNPARHDFGTKVLLGRTISDSGFDEIEQAVTLIVQQPACAHFIARKLATYFVADDPPPALVDRMAQTFQRTNGDITAVLRTLFQADELNGALGHKFKDPMRYVLSAVRLAYDGRTLQNTRPMLNWLNALGEPPYGRATPDGYPLSALAWSSAGQMSRRFEIARAIGSGNAGLFDADTGAASGAAAVAITGFPQLASRLYYADLEITLSPGTRTALERAASQQEWNTFLLSSPEFNYE